jgi:hypothetical protein
MPRSRFAETTPRTRGEKLQKLRQVVFAVYGDMCWLCGFGEADTIDHVLPLSMGGNDHIDNLRPAHGRKSKTCVGNYSRKRPAFRGERPKPKPSDEPDGITYGDGWISRKRGSMITKMYISGNDLDDPFVQAFISS